MYNKFAEKIAKAILDFDPYCGCSEEELADAYSEVVSDNPRACADEMRNLAEGYEDTPDGQALLRLADEIDREYKVDRFAITEDDKRLMLIITSELCKMKYDDLNRLLGSLTIKEMWNLHGKLEHEGFCKRNGIARWEDMTANDYEREYHEKWDS